MARNGILLAILAAALLLRLQLAAAAPYMHDESQIAIPLAESLSFTPGQLNLPLRGLHHPALPSYVINLSGSVFGRTALGYRALSVIGGLLAIILIFRLTDAWYGRPAALWASALLAFNEYHIGVSAYATAKGPHLLLIATAIYAFSTFLRTDRVRSLYISAVAVALAFYCKEHSVLVLAAFGLTLLQPRYRHWLRSTHVLGACALFAILIVPDVMWNLRASVADPNATYRDHLSRVGGLGLTPDPFLFFARGAIQWVMVAITGEPLPDSVVEYPSMNAGFGVLLLGAVVASTLRAGRQDRIRGFLLILFWLVLAVFVLIRPGQPTKGMDPVTWYWADVVLFPAVILTGARLAHITGRWRLALWSAAAAAAVYATASIVRLS